MSFVATLQHDAELAPSEIFGTVAHELRQPLSNIEAIAYYLTLVLPESDQKIQAQLERIRELVEQTNQILSSGLRAARAAAASGVLSLESLPSESADPVEGA